MLNNHLFKTRVSLSKLKKLRSLLTKLKKLWNSHTRIKLSLTPRRENPKVQMIEKDCKGFTHDLLYHSHKIATTSSLSKHTHKTWLDNNDKSICLPLHITSRMFIHGVDEQLTRTSNGVHYLSKHTWIPNGVHLLLIWRDLASDVTSRNSCRVI